MAKELVVGGKLVESAVQELAERLGRTPEEADITAEGMKDTVVGNIVLPLLGVAAQGRTISEILRNEDIAKKVRGLKEDGVVSVLLDDADFNSLKSQFEAFKWPANEFQSIGVRAAYEVIKGASDAPVQKKEES